VNNGAGAGQVVMHTHWHIMPRRPGDGHKLWHGAQYKEGEMEQVAASIRSKLG